MSVFSYRGALPPKSPMFFGRDNELRELLEISRSPLQSYVIIFGGRQLGKTSLLYQLRARLPADIQFVQIDLTPLSGNEPLHVYRYLAEELTDRLNLVSTMDLQTINDGTRFRRFLRGLNLNSLVIVALDELGGLTDAASQSLARTLRSIHQDRFEPGNEAFERFLFILAGGIELYRPVSLSPVSPLYNISEKCYLGDLSRVEHDQLLVYGLGQAGMSVENASLCCPTIYELTHGHPYLTQRLGNMIEEYFIRHQSVPDNGAIHDFVAKLMTDDEFHIGPLLKRVQIEGLQKTLMQIVTQPCKLPFVRADSEIARLELISLIREEQGFSIIRNKIFASALKGILDSSSSPMPFQVQQLKFIKLHLTSLDRKRLRVHVLESPSGEPQASSRLPFTPSDMTAVLKALQALTIDRFSSEQIQTLKRLKLLHEERLAHDLLRRVGEHLYKALMVDDVNVAFEIARSQMRTNGMPVTLQLRFDQDAVELTRYPWELLFDGKRHLLPSKAAELVRYITYPETPSHLKVRLPLNLLYVASRPTDLISLSVSKERDEVRNSLRKFEQEGLLQIIDLPVPSRNELLSYLNKHQVHILHFDGHGIFARRCPNCENLNYPHLNQCGNCKANLKQVNALGYLAFEEDNQTRQVEWVSSFTLEHIFYQKPPSLVVLSACSSAAVRGESVFGSLGPSLIRAGIPAVVATQLPISTRGATIFCKGFYEALVNFQSVPAAVNSGRQQLFTEKEFEWFVPVLYLRSKDDEGYLFLPE